MVDHADRLARTRQALEERGLDAYVAGPSADLFWLVGYRALPLERLTLLIVPARGEPSLLVPELEAPRAEHSGAADLVDLVTWKEDEDAAARAVDTMERLGVPRDGDIAVQDRLWSVFLLHLQG